MNYSHRSAIYYCWTAGLFALVAAAGASANPARDLPPRWRGNNIDIHVLNPELIQFLAQFHCNALRVLIDVDEKEKPLEQQKAPTAENPLLPYEENLKKLDAILPLCRAANIQVILAVGDVYGRKIDVFWREVEGSKHREHLVTFWAAMSRRYRDEPAIVAYDIKNEPSYKPADAGGWWQDTLPKSIKAIRGIDQTAWLVIEPGPSGMPWGFANMPAIEDHRVIYSFHHYMPHAYTIQGIRFLQHRGPDTRDLYSYPGEAPRFDGGKLEAWNKQAMEETMIEVVRFQKRNPTARIYVGEFGVVRWAPGAAQWLADSLEIIERHGWDWTFHCVGDWNGFDPTYAADDPPRNRPTLAGEKDTDRLKILKEAWRRNLEPSPAATTSPDR